MFFIELVMALSTYTVKHFYQISGFVKKKNFLSTKAFLGIMSLKN